MPDPRPIGMLDSGVGGLAVLREVRRLLPHESILYMADQGHLPYGPRPHDEIRSFVRGIFDFLIGHHCKLIAIPCNTANTVALHAMRRQFPDLPIVGMEPAIKPAAAQTQTGVIGVISTQATYDGELFASTVNRFANGLRVEAQACPELVLLVEQGVPDTAASRATVARSLQPLQAAGIDQLVLACTHFTFLEPLLREQLGPAVSIVDPAPAVARQMVRVLEERGLNSDPAQIGSVRYITTGDPHLLRNLIVRLIGDEKPAVEAAYWKFGALLFKEIMK